MTKDERFTKYYQIFSGMIYQYTFVRTGDTETAQDITQQVFYLFFQKMDRIPDGIVKAWLLLCGKHKIIDEYRKQQIRKKNLYDGYLMEVQILQEDNAEKLVKRMMQEQLSFRVLDDLKKKNEGWYQIVEAVCVLELSQEEAAKRLGITKPVLAAKLYRARHYLWNKYGIEYQSL